MRAFGYLSLLGSLLFAAVSSQQTSDLSRRDERLQQFYNHMAKDGTCLIYIDTFATNDGLTPCGIFCKANGQPEDKIGCHSEHIYDPEGSYPKDPDGWEWYPGKCICAEQIDPIAEAIAIPIIEALAKLDEIICGVFVQAIVESINIGFALVPGAGQAVASARAATKAAVEGAKSFAENSMNPTDFFDGWVKKSCGMDKIELDYDNTFDSLVNAPDSVGTSKGCKRKNKGDCRTLDAKPDPPTTTKNDNAPETTKKEEAPETTKKDDGPKTTKKDDVQTTTKTEAGPTTTATRSSTSSANPRGTPVNCQSCRSSKAKKAAREARWGSMFVPRAPGDSCLLDSSRSDDGCTASGLLARENVPLQEANPNLIVDGRPFIINCGKHKPCASAKNDGLIDKYYYLEGDAKCGGVLKHGTKKDVGDARFQNDHVYEKQTLALFFEWLGDGDMTPIGGSTKPQASWVANVILDDESPRNFKMQASNIPLGIPAEGAPLDNVLGYGIARSDPLDDRNGAEGGMTIDRTAKNFALVAEKVNLYKGTFFRQSRPLALEQNHPSLANKNRNWIRNHAAVFQYLSYTHPPPSKKDTKEKKEDVWNKWMRVSNWVDLVLSEFDQSYVWGNHPDEPRDAANGPAWLRSFYAHWIDMYLAGIEKNAQDWADEAALEFELKYGNDNEAAATQWMTKAFGDKGFATRAKMKFPRPRSGPSVYGAYGNPTMTRDRNGAIVILGSPAPL